MEGQMTGAPRRSRRATNDLEVANWFFDHGLEGFVVIRAGLIERVNARWTQILGWRSDQVCGRSIWDFVHPDDAARVGEVIQRLPDEPAVACEHRAIGVAGAEIWVRSRVSSVQGVAALVMVEDITQERAEAAMLEQARRSSELMHAAAGVFMWRYDPDDAQYVANPEFVGADGPIDLSPRSAERVRQDIHPDDVERVSAAWDVTLQTGEFAVAEYRDFQREGRWRWLRSAWKGARRKPSGLWLIEGITQDLTEQAEAREVALRTAEEAHAANRAKSDFLATMSHEIRTPLNGVLGMAQAMAADELTPRQRGRLDVVRRSGETLLAILNDVLDLSKMEAGKLELESADFDLAEIATSAHAAFAAVAAKKRLEFDLIIEPAARATYRGDAVRVRQVLFNLISNAVKFTDAGAVRVRASFDGQDLRLTVSDTGMGIDRDRIAMLFEKFVQVDTSTTRRFGGTGLGLAICQELVRRMGGAIEVDSVPGQGSNFTVRLPLPQVAQAPATVQGAPPAPEQAPPAASLQVLAAEDNEVNRVVLLTLLLQFGLDPVIVEDGLQAVQAWEARDWDAILMDIQMPVLDGVSAVKLIRRREAARGRRRTPIIALTANALAHQAAEYRAVGMDAVVAKPIEIRKLLDALQLAAQLSAADPVRNARSA
jgi:PAS domain S-box-containing protein